MLSKDKRLNLKTDFKWVAEGKSATNPFFRFFYRYGENSSPKVGVALNSKFFKKAHQRNRAKRLTQDVFFKLYQKLKSNLNIIALPNSRVFEVKSDSLEQEVRSTLLKEGLLNEENSNIDN